MAMGASVRLNARDHGMERKMNIFYIVGVVVVVIFIAGFFGLHMG
jgi:hypothetical protein